MPKSQKCTTMPRLIQASTVCNISAVSRKPRSSLAKTTWSPRRSCRSSRSPLGRRHSRVRQAEPYRLRPLPRRLRLPVAGNLRSKAPLCKLLEKSTLTSSLTEKMALLPAMEAMRAMAEREDPVEMSPVTWNLQKQTF